MMHEEIIRYSLDGEIPDVDIVKRKERMVTALETQMRDFGCVRCLDIEPQFTLDYLADKETYKFTLTLYGVYVGGTEAWNIAGVMGGKTILRSTPKIRFRASSNTAE